MEKELHNHYGGPELRRYDRVWQRVAPNLEPYPGYQAMPALADLPGQSTPSAPPTGGVPESQLPGAEQNPCCMGTEAEEMLEVLDGFIEEELTDRRYTLALARQAPSWARQSLRDLAEAAGRRARRLMAVHYLITGVCYQPSLDCQRVCTGAWCPALRERYHAEACDGLNYIRAAEGTVDPCLAELLRQMSRESYQGADSLLRLLERALRG